MGDSRTDIEILEDLRNILDEEDEKNLTLTRTKIQQKQDLQEQKNQLELERRELDEKIQRLNAQLNGLTENKLDINNTKEAVQYLTALIRQNVESGTRLWCKSKDESQRGCGRENLKKMVQNPEAYGMFFVEKESDVPNLVNLPGWSGFATEFKHQKRQ